MTSDSRGWPRKVVLAVARRGWEQRWAISVAVLAALAVALTVTVRNTDLLPGERSVSRWMFEHAGGAGKDVSAVLDVGMSKEVAPVMLAVLIPLVWWAWGRYAAFALVLAGLIAALSLIDLASRPVPTDEFAFGGSADGVAGYPSGHVIYAVIVLGFPAFLASRYGAPTRTRTALVWALVTLVVLMGPSRLVEQAHWPADVIGGYLIGLALLLGTIWLHNHTLSWIGPRFPRLYSLLTGDPPPRPGETP